MKKVLKGGVEREVLVVKVSAATLRAGEKGAAERLGKPLPFTPRQERELAAELLQVFQSEEV